MPCFHYDYIYINVSPKSIVTRIFKKVQVTAINPDIIVIGGGLAGLTCARTLHRAGRKVFVAEGDDDIGGRIRTDRADGFLMDRGFQVLQTAYPEARTALDFDKLKLRTFDPGVVVRKNGTFQLLADPLRAPRYFLHTLFSKVGSFADKLRVLKLYYYLQRQPMESFFSQPDIPTRQFLTDFGFSHDMIQSFFKPFFAGVSLDPDIEASNRVFKYIFRMFASGEAAIPENGMQEIPRQVASALPRECIGTHMRVSRLTGNGIQLTDGREISAGTFVLATDALETRHLLGEVKPLSYFTEHCLYFTADRPPFSHSMLVLNGDGTGPIINFTVPGRVSPGYAPRGKTLMAAVVIGKINTDEGELRKKVTGQLREWFGPVVDQWHHLRTYNIKKALPDQKPPQANPLKTNPRIRENVYVCGEYNSVPSIQWALYSGRKAAEAILGR